ncbi:uncharacterized protein [Spinacia oleracea]|uniref:DUF241 domain-containing protein n=1 Tax=Spinacia oleracea TaxID=3562 RepID=A0A9R0J4T9_SPIOL|nr:uncharacterized protein LOC110800391 [Spinacia oleracea]
MASWNHVRSASFPPKSNPILEKIDNELMKLRKAEAASTSVVETVCIGLTGLATLYKCVNNVLCLPLVANQTLPLTLFKKEAPLIQGSSKLLQICGASKEMLLRLLETVRAFRCFNNETDISDYFSMRKEIVKTAKGLALELRQIEGSLISGSEFNNNAEFEVIRVLRCVSIINISVLDSLLRFLAMPLKSSSSIMSKSTKFGFISKKNKHEAKLNKNGNALSNVDVVLHGFHNGEDCIDCDLVKKRLELLEVCLRGIEDGLNNILKQLARTRASLIRIISA